VKSVKELIALAKARRESSNTARARTGAATHLASELFNSWGCEDRAHPIQEQRRCGDAASQWAVAGDVRHDRSGRGHIKSGRVRALAVSTAAVAARARLAHGRRGGKPAGLRVGSHRRSICAAALRQRSSSA
jgi:tripartite-type tricarboxylate transporter receptor subunit TctC